MNNTKRQAPSCGEVIVGLLILLLISAICRGITAVVVRHNMEQIYHYRQQISPMSDYRFGLDSH